MQHWRPAKNEPIALPFFLTSLRAGFPSPANDHLDENIDLNTLLVENEPATFIIRVAGDSMEGVGIFEGDLAIVNRALNPVDGSLVVAIVNGDFTLKTLRYIEGQPWLYPENPRYQPIRIHEGMDFLVWGVIKHSIRIHT